MTGDGEDNVQSRRERTAGSRTLEGLSRAIVVWVTSPVIRQPTSGTAPYCGHPKWGRWWRSREEMRWREGPVFMRFGELRTDHPRTMTCDEGR